MIVSGLLLVLWLRNFWRADVVWMPMPRQGHLVIASHQGQVELSLFIPSSATPGASARRVRSGARSDRWGAQSYAVGWNHLHEILFPITKPYRYRRLPLSHEVNIIAPYWFLVPLTWLFAAAPWIRWSTQFSLRALMIAMTLAAVATAVYAASGW